jgi:uncharacterized protein (DUF305 family)
MPTDTQMSSSRRIPPSWLIAAGVLAAVALAVTLVALLGGDPAGSSDDSAPSIVQPAAPGEAGSELSEDDLEDIEPPPYTAADVGFMQDMIPHHEQAIEMTNLVAERSESEDIALLAGRIEISQKGEIALMEDWLSARGEELPTGRSHDGAHGNHAMPDHGSHAMSDGGLMPGMLTESQFARLSAASGGEFDRLFCDLMIQHHRGALTMVDEQRATGGGIEAEGYKVSADIEADQRIEIQRMRQVLRGIGNQ